jgi:hypothetical protein
MSHSVSVHLDARGLLGVLEFAQLPFLPQRFFWIGDVPSGTARAGHAHRSCTQLLFGLKGSITATMIDQQGIRKEAILRAGDSLLVPPVQWLSLTDFAAHSMLGVLASQPYDPAEYITDFAEFNNLTVNQSSRSA